MISAWKRFCFSLKPRFSESDFDLILRDFGSTALNVLQRGGGNDYVKDLFKQMGDPLESWLRAKTTKDFTKRIIEHPTKLTQGVQALAEYLDRIESVALQQAVNRRLAKDERDVLIQASYGDELSSLEEKAGVFLTHYAHNFISDVALSLFFSTYFSRYTSIPLVINEFRSQVEAYVECICQQLLARHRGHDDEALTISYLSRKSELNALKVRLKEAFNIFESEPTDPKLKPITFDVYADLPIYGMLKGEEPFASWKNPAVILEKTVEEFVKEHVNIFQLYIFYLITSKRYGSELALNIVRRQKFTMNRGAIGAGDTFFEYIKLIDERIGEYTEAPHISRINGKDHEAPISYCLALEWLIRVEGAPFYSPDAISSNLPSGMGTVDFDFAQCLDYGAAQAKDYFTRLLNKYDLI